MRYFLFLALLFASTPANAARTPLGVFEGWAAFKDTAPEALCYVVAQPQRSLLSRKDVKRSPPHLMVSFWPGRKISGQIQVVLGFPVNSGDPVRLDVGGQRFQLAGRGDSAWPLNAQTDSALLSVLRKSAEFSVTVRSGRGTEIKDTYALSGFNAALAAGKAGCP